MKVEEVSTLITQRLETIVGHRDQALSSTIVVPCFNIFAICIRVRNGGVSTTTGLEQLAAVSPGFFYHTFHCLTVVDPTSSVLEDICQNYYEVLPDGISFVDLPSQHTMTMIDTSIRRNWTPQSTQGDDRLSNHEHLLFAQDIAELAQAEYQQNLEIPKWIFDFAFNSLSMDPHLPASAVANCLKVIAINLGCDLSKVTTLNRRYVPSNLISIHHLTKS